MPRFERIAVVPDPELADPQPGDEDGGAPPPPRTAFYRDPSRSALAFNDSPDLGFDASLNPYRGCEHGCAYCYARPTHEYLGWSAGLDFETRILVKQRAPELLRAELSKPGWRPRVIALSGVTDAYQPIEARLRITRRCLEVLAELRNPVAVVTKSALVSRDADLLAALAGVGAAAVTVSVTTLDRGLARALEPRAASPARRLAAIGALARAGVPVGALFAPVIPGLNDHEIPRVVEAVARAGGRWVSHVLLRLPHGLGPLFEDWLERHFPERRAKVMGRVRAVRGGRLYDARYGVRQRGTGPYAEHLRDLVRVACRRAGLATEGPALSAASFRRPSPPQLPLFGDG